MTFIATRTSGRSVDPDQARPWPGPAATALLIATFFALLTAMFVVEERRRLADPVLKGQRGEVTSASAESLLRAERLGRALTLIGAAGPAGSTVESLRLTPTAINAVIAEPNGRRHSVDIDLALALTKQESGAVRGEGPQAAEIDASMPTRLIDRARRNFGLKPGDLDYVLLSARSGQPGKATWGLYYSEPPLDNDLTADFDGSNLRVIGQ